MTTTPTHPSPVRIAQPWQGVARALIGLMGLQLLLGAVYFTFFADADDGGVVTGFDMFVAGWALLSAAGLLLAATLPRIPGLAWRSAAAWVVLFHGAWGVVKLTSYDELVPSLVSLGLDAVVLMLLWLGRPAETA